MIQKKHAEKAQLEKLKSDKHQAGVARKRVEAEEKKKRDDAMRKQK